MDHHYSLGLYTPTHHVLYKLNKTWNVLQKTDEHRALSNVDTKYDALTHIWALKTTQNKFKWQQCTCLSTNWRQSFPACLSLYGHGTQSGCRYRWLISYVKPLSDGTPAHIRIHFIFLASKVIGLHFPTNDIGLSALKFFWWAQEFLFISFRPFKVIQGQWIWCQSKARMRLPISP